MKTLTLWKWRYRDPVGGKRVTTRHLATEEEARAQLPSDAERLEWTREDRLVPETAEEAQQLSTRRLAGR